MTNSRQEVFENMHNVRLIRKDKYWLSNIINKIFPRFDNFYTTFRFPFCKAVITYPTTIEDPMKYRQVLKHELVHVKQFKPWYGPLFVSLLYILFPLPVFFSGRWLIERDAYLVSIKEKEYSVAQAVYTLWYSYFYPWPRSWMTRWFEKKLNTDK